MTSAERAAPGQGEVWLEHDAIGVNYLDVMQRRGVAPLALPNGLGVEGVGRVVNIGAGVEGYREGDRVGYVLGPYPDRRAAFFPSMGQSTHAQILYLEVGRAPMHRAVRV